MNKELKFSVDDKINVVDIFGCAKKWVVKKSTKLIKRIYRSIKRFVTLTWSPILARCPDDAGLILLSNNRLPLLR